MQLYRLRAVIVKELRQLRRDRLTFAMIIGIPIIQLLLFGFAINMDVRNLEAAVLDQAKTVQSRDAIAEINASQVLRLQHTLNSPEEVNPILRTGKVGAVLVIPPDFEARIQRKNEAPIQLIVDGSDQVLQSATRQLLNYALPGWVERPSISIVYLYNPQRLAPLNTVPGLIGMILTMTMVLFTAIVLVREQERGNLELLLSTPLSAHELLFGKILPFAAIGLIQLTLILIVSRLIFDVPIRGSLLDLYLACLVFIVANLTLGIVISTFSKSQFQAMQLTIFTYLPQFLLSGFVFPYTGMPKAAQWLAEVLPMTHFLRLARGIMLRGAELLELWKDLLGLLLFAAIMLTIAALKTRKQLD